MVLAMSGAQQSGFLKSLPGLFVQSVKPNLYEKCLAVQTMTNAWGSEGSYLFFIWCLCGSPVFTDSTSDEAAVTQLLLCFKAKSQSLFPLLPWERQDQPTGQPVC